MNRVSITWAIGIKLITRVNECQFSVVWRIVNTIIAAVNIISFKITSSEIAIYSQAILTRRRKLRVIKSLCINNDEDIDAAGLHNNAVHIIEKQRDFWN